MTDNAKLEKGEKMNRFGKTILLILSVFFLITGPTGGVFAQEAEKAAAWQFGAEIYLWGASVGGTSGSGSDIDVDFDDLLEDLKLGFMGAFGAQKGKWLFLADAIYLDVEDDTTVGPGIGLSAELTGWIVTPMVGYNLVDTDRFNISIIGGARYLYLDTEVKLGSITEDDSGSVWDGIVGVRGHLNLTDKLYLPYHLDIGTGDSDVTWQGLGGIGYRFKHFDVIGAYRYLSWDFDSGDQLDDLNLHGPFLGFKFRF
jgi:hypothetical protein